MSKSRELLRAKFVVSLNGKPIRRPITLPHYRPRRGRPGAGSSYLEDRGLGYEIVYLHAPRGPLVPYEGYLVVQGAEVFPRELQGLLIRLRGVAVGWHRSFGVGSGVMSTMAPAISGEVWVDGLDEALQFDRESFREDHPAFRWFRERIEEVVRGQEKGFRQRSTARTARERADSKTGTTDAKAADAQAGKAGAKTEAGKTSGDSKAGAAKGGGAKSAGGAQTGSKQTDGDAFILQSIFDGQRDYITRLIPQINGCWEREYREACAVMVRRLVETLIIELYARHGLEADVKDEANSYLGMKALVDKLCGDPHFGIDRRCADWLKELKDLGDAAAHDFKIRVRKDDLNKARRALRFAAERLVFEISKPA